MTSRAKLCLSAVIILGALFTIGVTPARADAPDSINYQSILRTSGGSPVPDGNYTVTFRIYDAPLAGPAALWSETKSVTTVGGSYMTLLGSVTPLPASVFSAPNRFLGISVSPDPEMTPRVALVTVPYAFRVETVDGATGGAISGDVTVSGGNINLDWSTATTGNILKEGTPFIHNYGLGNTFIGRNAGNLSMTGALNTGSGSNVLSSNTTGTSNTADGGFALEKNTTGGGNTATGAYALTDNTTGFLNTASGVNALKANTTGGLNTASGVYALQNNTTGNNNSACGVSALNYNDAGSNNTASGFQALYSNTSGGYNTASGMNALFSNTTGSNNSASGSFALYSNTTGHSNTGSGLDALFSNTTGNGNTASGYIALKNNTIGHGNTAIGVQALYNNSDGGNNTACGVSALNDNTAGVGNTASGNAALWLNTTGGGNTASGYYALYSNITGSSNTAIGDHADVAASALTNATAIGANAMVDASNKIRLGNSSVTVIEGQVAYTFTSDKNQKENFRPVDGNEVLRKIRAMSLTSWNYKGHDPEQFRHYGPVAQEFFEAFGHDGVGTSGTPTTINSGDEAGILMIAVQTLTRDSELIKAENQDLRAQIAELREMIRIQTTNAK